MIVITALIDAPGLGQDTLRACIRNDVGAMFDAGLAIVILAIVLDRLTEGGDADRSPAHAWRRAGADAGWSHRGDRRHRVVAHRRLGLLPVALRRSPATIAFSFRGPVNAFVDWLRSDVAWLTGGHQGHRQPTPSSTRSRRSSRSAPVRG